MVKLNVLQSLYLCMLVVLVSACSTYNGRYQQKHDSTPKRLPSASELHNATPRAEQHSRGGNKDYQVRGKHYKVLKSAESFQQTGIASWYGRKFHGHLTSNGEIYDMYAMSAAHKNLPLPTYLKVVNNDNGKSVVVRVNDRGPFHASRIIDLSYSAAYKLDMLKTGTANVTVTAVTDFSIQGLAQLEPSNSSINKTVTPSSHFNESMGIPDNTLTKVNSNTDKIAEPVSILKSESNNTSTPVLVDEVIKSQYIQVFASSSNIQAKKIANELSAQYQINTLLEKKNGIFRVLAGPIERSDELTRLLLAIKKNKHPKAFIRK